MISGAPASARAQSNTSIAYHLPPSTKLYVEFDSATLLNPASHSSKLASWSRRVWLRQANDPFESWRTVLQVLTDADKKSSLRNARLAIAAIDGEQTDEAVMLLSCPEMSEVATRLAAGPGNSVKRRGRVTVVQTQSGFMIARLGEVAAVFTPGHRRGPFDTLVKQMNQRDRPSLATVPGFQEAVAEIGDDAKGFLFFQRSSYDKSRNSSPLFMFPSAQHALASIHGPESETEFRIQIALHPSDFDSGKQATEQLLISRLPQTSLLAWSGGIDGIQEETLQSRLTLSLMKPFMASDSRNSTDDPIPESDGPSWLPSLGRQVTFVLGMETVDDARTLMATVLVESQDPAGSYARIRDVALERDAASPGNEQEESADPGVELKHHLGRELCVLSASGDLSNQEEWGRRFFSTARPTVSSFDGQVLFSTHPLHAKRILEGFNTLAPTLGGIEEFRDPTRSNHPTHFTMYAQPALAFHALDQWLKGNHSASFPSSQPATRSAEPHHRGRLGIRAKSVPESGKVIVIEVDPKGPSRNKLRVGDHILGAQGMLLPLRNPSRELKRLVDMVSPDQEIILRVERSETHLDVELPGNAPSAMGGVLDQPLLQSLIGDHDLWSAVSYLRCSVQQTKPDRIQVELVFSHPGSTSSEGP